MSDRAAAIREIDHGRPGASPVALAAIFIGYVVLSQAGFALAGQATMASPFRPASGLALAALVMCGVWAWPAVFAAALAVALGVTHDPVLSIITAVGHTLGAMAGALLIDRFAGGTDVFNSVRATLRAVSFVLLSACVPTASIAVFGAWLDGPDVDTWSAFPAAWLGHVTGMLVVAPCVLFVPTLWALRATRRQWGAIAEGLGFLASLALVALVVFAGFIPAEVKTYPLEFLCLPFLLWAAFRFGPREVALSVALVASAAVWGTLRNVGPFAGTSAPEAIYLLQAYVSVIAITGIAFATAVDERRRAETRLQELATTDALTGLVNYRRLLDVLRQEIARSRRTNRPFAVLLVDMDGLKRVNDRYGHLAGSRAICRVADVLRRCTRETDVVSRFGGDEFAVVLPESGDDGGRAVLQRVQARLAVDAVQPVLSVSGGHAVFPRDGDSPTLLLRAADSELYAAKHGTAAPAASAALALSATG